MKSISLETLYSILNKHILLAQSYTDIPELSFIIKSCRLKPYSYFFENKTNKIILQTWWFDEYSNSLKIVKGKRLKIIQGDLSLDRNKIICTDLYNGLSIEKVIKISKVAHIIYGKDEDLYQDCLIMTLLGIDNYLRSYMYFYGEWKQVSPLLIGLKQLKIIANHTDIKYFRELKFKENLPLPCVEAKVWLTSIPPSRDILELLDKQCGIVYSLLSKQ